MVPHLFAAVFLVGPSAPEPGIVARAETTALRRADGAIVRRVRRDAAGRVAELRLNGMRLSQQEFEEIGRLPEVRQLVLADTNLDDAGLKPVAHCRQLESLNLTGTAVSDDGLTDLAELTSLKYLCLGNVRVSPAAVTILRGRYRSRGQTVGLGYSQRKP